MKPGVYPNLTYEQYAAIPALRSSDLSLFDETTPAHYLHAKEKPREDKPHFAEGRALHYAVLESHRFSELVRTRRMPTAAELDCYSSTGKPGFWTAEQKALRDSTYAQLEAELEGADVILDPDQMERVTAMADSLLKDRDFAELLEKDHQTELTIVWEDEDTGLLQKCRLDLWVPSEGIYCELKSTRRLATVEQFSRDIYAYGYHRQCAHYLDGIESQLGGARKVDPVILAVVEKSPPYLPAVRPLDMAALAVGRAEIQRIRQQYAICAQTNNWPGHDNSEAWGLPGWCGVDDLELTFGEE